MIPDDRTAAGRVPQLGRGQAALWPAATVDSLLAPIDGDGGREQAAPPAPSTGE